MKQKVYNGQLEFQMGGFSQTGGGGGRATDYDYVTKEDDWIMDAYAYLENFDVHLCNAWIIHT